MDHIERRNKLRELAVFDQVPQDEIMDLALHLDCVGIQRQHEDIQTRWRVRILVAGVLDIAASMEGVETVTLDFTNAMGPGWSLKKSMQVQAAPGHDPVKIAKNFERAGGSVRSRLGASREVFQSIALQFGYSRVEIDPREGDTWRLLAVNGERINAQSIAQARQQVMESATGQAAGPGRALPRM